MSTPSDGQRQPGEPDPATEWKSCQNIVNEAPIGIFQTSVEGRFINANPAVARIFGYPSSAALIEDVTDIAGQLYIDPEERTALLRRIAEAPNFLREEVPFRRRDGAVLLLNLYAHAVRDAAGTVLYIEGFLEDITERKQAEEALRNSEARFRAIFDRAPLGIALIDSHTGQFLQINERYSQIVGRTQDEMLSRDFQSITHPDDLHADLDLMRQLREGAVRYYTLDKRYLRPDGSIVWVVLTVVPMWEAGESPSCHLAMAQDITERKQAERALQLSEQKYRELVENANSIIIRWTRDGTLTFINEYGLRFFGYTEEELLGRSVLGTIVPVVESTGRDLQELMERILENPSAYEHNENENMRRNGERVWIDWTNKIVLDDEGHVKEILSIGTDITERKRTEEALKESEALFRSLADSANAAIGILQGNKLVYANPYLASISGYTQQELLEMAFSDILAPEDRQMVLERAGLRQAGAQPLTSRYEVRMLTKDGRMLTFDFAAALIEYRRQPAVIGIAYDITERKQSETELREYREHLEDLVRERTTDLARANDRLRELDRLKSMFIASMSHELRTPLNSIIGFTGMTIQGLSGELNDEQHDNLTRVYQSAKHLLALITDVIDISKIEAGRIETFPTRFSLRELIDEAVQDIMPQAHEKGLPVAVELTEDLELYLDRKRLLQCLLNLLSNAVKFTENGGVTVAARTVDQELVLSVTDTGIGIAEEDIPKLFEAFERLETHMRVKAGGTGLGLYLTKKIVTDLLHGQVSVQSQVGIGSTFAIQIPLEEKRHEDGVDHRG